ncbi:hypothetical protein AAC387_Pa09g1159 [Persea americana]
MVHVKIRRQVQGEGIHRKKLLCSNANALGLEDSDDDSAVLKLASAGCELAMVEDQFCSIPYELYDLPNLKEILSLETWNSCLTEEERFSLSAFLPDMDQHTFWLTMKELLSGKNMFFGSPLTVFFEMMKGGFYPPNVTCLREGLQFLQKRTYYHSLRLYHENMNRTFSDMRKAWSKCRSRIGVEERVHIWNNSKNHRAMTVVDLNAFPEDEDLSEKSTVRASMDPVPKTVKYPPVIALAPLKTNGKGVLKVKPKPASLYSNQTGMVCRPTPKGVLKVVPRGPLGQMHEPRTIPGRQELPTLGFQMSRLSPFPQSTCGWDAEPYCEESQLPYQLGRSGRACKSLKAPDFSIDRQRVKHLKNCTPGPSGNLHSSFRKKRYAKDPTFVGTTDVPEVNSFSKNCRSVKKYYCRSSQIQEHLNGEDLWQNIGQQKREHYQDSREQQMALMHDNRIQLHPKTLDTVLRISGVGTGQQQIPAASSLEQPKEVYRDVKGEEIQQLYDEPAVSKGLQDAPTLPITYKRRKAFLKVNKLDIANPQTAGHPSNFYCLRWMMSSGASWNKKMIRSGRKSDPVACSSCPSKADTGTR